MRYRCSVLAALVVLLAVSVAALAQGQQTPSCTVFVQPGESIQVAIDNAPAGAVICLGQGTWNENIKITKSITLRGQGAGQTTIKAKKSGSPVVDIDIPSGTGRAVIGVNGLAVTGAQGDKGVGILITGVARTTIVGCAAVGNEQGGIMFTSNANAGQNAVGSSAPAGESKRTRGIPELTVEGCTITNNGFGILLGSDIQAIIVDNVIQKNSLYGIFSLSFAVGGGNNRMSENGVDLVGNISGVLRKPLVAATAAKIAYPDPRYPSLQYAIDALLPGGTLYLQSESYTTGVTIAKKISIKPIKQGAATLHVKILSLINDADLSLAGVKLVSAKIKMISKNVSGGIIMGGSAHAVADNCSFSDGAIQLFGHAQVKIAASNLSQYYVMLLENSHGELDDCQFQSAWSAWISATDNTQAVINKCTISNGTIQLFGRARASITGTTVTNASFGGISLAGNAQATIADCNISQNQMGGIMIGDNAQATIADSTIAKNTEGGVLLHDSAEVTISGCTIRQNDGNGIELTDIVSATIVENKILDNSGYGIILDGGSCGGAPAFVGHNIAGKGNFIPGPGSPDGNEVGAVCPEKISFLMSSQGGKFGW